MDVPPLNLECLQCVEKALDRGGPGDWLSVHQEKGQSFSVYRSSKRGVPALAGEAKVMYVQQLGDGGLPSEIVVKTVDCMGKYFGTPVMLLPRITDLVGVQSRRKFGGTQLLTGSCLDILRRVRDEHPDAVAVLGLTSYDLYPEDSWNFVFGQAR